MNRRFGRYELVTEIGRGGMAELWLGRLIGVGGFSKPVAIKRILPHLAQDPRFARMFVNEGTIAAKLSHPNLCQVFELGEVDGELFLAMEYLEGIAWLELVHAVVRDPPAIVRMAATVLGQACDGLAYAHDAKVVHRDISPGNLFITVDGICKVLDFGVSKIADETGETRTGMIKGKLPYMPPEQVRGDPDVDARVDVFAMGVVLWEAITGDRLFVRENDYLIYQAIMQDPIPSVLVAAPQVGAQIGGMLDAMIARALERDRDRRYSSIRSFADDLRAIAALIGGPIGNQDIGRLVRGTFAARLDERAKLVAVVTSAGMAPSPAPVVVAARARRGWIIGGAAAAAVALVIVLVALGTSSPTPVGTGRGSSSVARGDGTDGSNGSGSRDGGSSSDSADGSDRPQPRDSSSSGGGNGETGGRGSGSNRDSSRGGDGGGNGENGGRGDSSRGGGSGDSASDRPQPHGSGSSVPGNTSGSGSAAASINAGSGAQPRKTKPGTWSIDSKPYATIFVDGKRLDQTPIFRTSLAAGRHTIRARLADGRTKTFTIKIDPDKDVSSGTLTW